MRGFQDFLSSYEALEGYAESAAWAGDTEPRQEAPNVLWDPEKVRAFVFVCDCGRDTVVKRCPPFFPPPLSASPPTVITLCPDVFFKPGACSSVCLGMCSNTYLSKLHPAIQSRPVFLPFCLAVSSMSRVWITQPLHVNAVPRHGWSR